MNLLPGVARWHVPIRRHVHQPKAFYRHSSASVGQPRFSHAVPPPFHRRWRDTSAYALIRFARPAIQVNPHGHRLLSPAALREETATATAVANAHLSRPANRCCAALPESTDQSRRFILAVSCGFHSWRDVSGFLRFIADYCLYHKPLSPACWWRDAATISVVSVTRTSASCTTNSRPARCLIITFAGVLWMNTSSVHCHYCHSDATNAP